jgi:D-inositol-3-phosphate glycosyltransferase
MSRNIDTIDPRPASDGSPVTPQRVAVLSLHTSPQDQPGAGDSGGMNVYIREVAARLAAQGVAVDVFTRCRGRTVQEVEEVVPGSRVIQIPAGPCAPVAKEDLPRLLPAFLGGVLRRERHDSAGYDVVHSHYWLSGWVGRTTKEVWGVPLVASFHTLGRVKDLARADGEVPEPNGRLEGEDRIIEEADRIIAPTEKERGQLVHLYGADPGRIRVVTPGVDHRLFFPRNRADALARVGLSGSRVLLFVGRLQEHKGPDIAIATLARAVGKDPASMQDVLLAVIGGPSGAGGMDETTRLVDLAAALGVEDRVKFYPPQSQVRLADFYAAAEALIAPSRSESFGLVALEAQACGTPVVGARVGGLPYVVRDGETGFLVPDHDPDAYAERLLLLLRDGRLARTMGDGARVHASGFSWETTTAELRAVYRELVAARTPVGGPGG